MAEPSIPTVIMIKTIGTAAAMYASGTAGPVYETASAVSEKTPAPTVVPISMATRSKAQALFLIQILHSYASPENIFNMINIEFRTGDSLAQNADVCLLLGGYGAAVNNFIQYFSQFFYLIWFF